VGSLLEKSWEQTTKRGKEGFAQRKLYYVSGHATACAQTTLVGESDWGTRGGAAERVGGGAQRRVTHIDDRVRVWGCRGRGCGPRRGGRGQRGQTVAWEDR
jgi:hypothetical protein